MIGADDELSIFQLAETALARARYAYAKTFGVDIYDKSIDAEIERALLLTFDYPGPATVSAKVLLAIWLRENKLRGRGPQGKTPKQVLAEERVLREGRKVRAALQAKGMDAGAALAKAAKAVAARTKLSEETAIDALRRRKRRPARKRSRGHSAK